MRISYVCLSIDLQLPKYIVFEFNIVILSILNFKAINCITNIQMIVQINNTNILFTKSIRPDHMLVAMSAALVINGSMVMIPQMERIPLSPSSL